MSTILRIKAVVLVLSLASLSAAAAPPPAPASRPAVRAAQAPLEAMVRRAGGAYMFISGGCGVAISDDGYVITNAHVVHGGTKWRMRSGTGKTYTADVVGRAPNADLALLKIRGTNFPPHLEIGDSDRLRTGQPVVTVGNPFNLGGDNGVPAVALGAVSALGVDRPNSRDCVVTDAPINPGNSGGPLLTMDGKLVGLNEQVATRFGVHANTGVGYAVSSAQIHRYLPALKVAGGKEVATGALIGAEMAQGRIAEARVRRVAANSPAGRAGLRPGDVIRRLGEWPVRDSGRLVALAERFPSGTRVPMVVVRGGKALRLNVTLGTPVRGAVGVFFGRGNRTLRVDRVIPGGPAQRAGLKPGDVISAVGGVPVHQRRDLEAVLSEARAGETVHLMIRRGGKSIHLPLALAPAAEIQRLLEHADEG